LCSARRIVDNGPMEIARLCDSGLGGMPRNTGRLQFLGTGGMRYQEKCNGETKRFQITTSLLSSGDCVFANTGVSAPTTSG
jgi:hypothetical protein